MDADEIERLRIAIGRIQRRLRTGAPGGLTPSQFSTLITVARSGPMAVSDLADVENVPAPSLSRIIGRLEDKGLLSREPSPTDRRRATVTVTEQGLRLLARTRRSRTRLLAAALSELGDDAEQLRAALPALEHLADSPGFDRG